MPTGRCPPSRSRRHAPAPCACPADRRRLLAVPLSVHHEAHPAVESRIESGHKGELLHRVGRREEIHNLWYFGLGPARCRPAPMPHAASFELTTSATHSYLEPM